MDFETREIIRRIISEELWAGDITSETIIEEDTEAKAKIITTNSGYVAGISEMFLIFDELNVKMRAKTSDGNKIERGDILATLRGPARGILAAETISLNLFTRMSGIATRTKKMMKKAKKIHSEIRIAPTRKTTPLLKQFDKRAIEIVGGEPHRYHLADFILITQNHLKIVKSIEKAVKKAKKTNESDQIEIEVKNKKQAVKATEANADIIMLKNFKPQKAKETIKTLKKTKPKKQPIIELSGKINLSNIEKYAKTKPDIISTPNLIQAPPLSMKLEINEK
ncbi:hypothetical protein AKJ49_01645 [candidate division MSBL1 archaeon SCGC-AAA382A03]|uniref:Nicotinate-nucleotide pyrophosphorylase [carboxylating] n=1 Tax=candidate division MSBL1 archaeon SCGC-AAA382A03 TaxID=1698278 RepID=A0A133VEI8_9EURY|nr:hypothetical protein AKJ49_01645 [candidate division MSBL1 archaeon SCGC-AAA382A03]